MFPDTVNMALNLEKVRAYASKGKDNYTAKISQMVTDYIASIPRQNTNYTAAGFGNRMTGNYEASAKRRQEHYTAQVLNAEKWYNNYLAAAQE